jgi:protein SCO1/2
MFATNAYAHPEAGDDYIPTPPPTYHANDVEVKEQLGAPLPRDVAFTTSEGKHVRLGELLTGELPTILTFNYSSCPMLCSLQLNGLSAALPQIATPAALDGKQAVFRVGQQFRIITIDLEPNEPLDKLAKMKERYIDRLPEEMRASAREGWTFLDADGDAAAIRRVADTVGFKYTYVPERAEWAHPAALIFLSSAGAVTRYVYGIEFEPAMMRDTIVKAGKAEPATAVGFLNRCYHYDPDANSHAHAGAVALRYGAAGFIVLLGSALGLAHFLKRQRRHGDMP